MEIKSIGVLGCGLMGHGIAQICAQAGWDVVVREVEQVAKPEAFFATNTSSLSVAEQAAATERPERFLGLHFFNPAQVMPLLEVVRTDATSDEAYALGFEVGQALGKTTVAANDN